MAVLPLRSKGLIRLSDRNSLWVCRKMARWLLTHFITQGHWRACCPGTLWCVRNRNQCGGQIGKFGLPRSQGVYTFMHVKKKTHQGKALSVNAKRIIQLPFAQGERLSGVRYVGAHSEWELMWGTARAGFLIWANSGALGVSGGLEPTWFIFVCCQFFLRLRRKKFRIK